MYAAQKRRLTDLRWNVRSGVGGNAIAQFEKLDRERRRHLSPRRNKGRNCKHANTHFFSGVEIYSISFLQNGQSIFECVTRNFFCRGEKEFLRKLWACHNHQGKKIKTHERAVFRSIFHLGRVCFCSKHGPKAVLWSTSSGNKTTPIHKFRIVRRKMQRSSSPLLLATSPEIQSRIDWGQVWKFPVALSTSLFLPKELAKRKHAKNAVILTPAKLYTQTLFADLWKSKCPTYISGHVIILNKLKASLHVFGLVKFLADCLGKSSRPCHLEFSSKIDDVRLDGSVESIQPGSPGTRKNTDGISWSELRVSGKGIYRSSVGKAGFFAGYFHLANFRLPACSGISYVGAIMGWFQGGAGGTPHSWLVYSDLAHNWEAFALSPDWAQLLMIFNILVHFTG